MRIGWQILASALLIAGTIDAAMAQQGPSVSLGELARRVRQEKKAPPKPVRLWDNDNIAVKTPGGASVVGRVPQEAPENAGGNTAAGQAGTAATPAAPAPAAAAKTESDVVPGSAQKSPPRLGSGRDENAAARFDPLPISVLAFPLLTPGQMSPALPAVFCDAGQLTITANDSTLGEILAAVRACTGAAFDIPESATGERMAAQVGPGTVRKVLTSFLNQTVFDYVILASPEDPTDVQRVLLMRRGAKAAEVVADSLPSPSSSQASASMYHRDPETDPKMAEEAVPDPALQVPPVVSEPAVSADGASAETQPKASAGKTPTDLQASVSPGWEWFYP